MANELGVCARLERARIDYMLTGSMAMNFYAQPRMTRDIDLILAIGLPHVNDLLHLFEAMSKNGQTISV